MLEACNMKDILGLATYAGKVACLVLFVNILEPDVIGATQAPSEHEYCRITHSVAQACGFGAAAEVSRTRIAKRRVVAEGWSLSKEQAC